MKIQKLTSLFCLIVLLTIVSGCRRNANTFWEDTQTAGRHVNRGFRSLGGKHTDSRQICSRDEFIGPDEYAGAVFASDYVPLADDPNVSEANITERMNPSSRFLPGEQGSPIPGIQAFKDPSTNPKLSGVFRNIHFPYNGNLVKGDDNLTIVRNVADYMKKNHNTYVFVEGHCDERGPESYNFSLGSQRSNAVRNMLISEGVNPDNIFTISYGKDRPIIIGHDEGSWQQNRRAEFKVYER